MTIRYTAHISKAGFLSPKPALCVARIRTGLEAATLYERIAEYESPDRKASCRIHISGFRVWGLGFGDGGSRFFYGPQ